MATPNASLNGAVTVDGGTLASGFSAGTMSVYGDFLLRSGILDIELGGTGTGQSDLIYIGGTAQLLGGRLEFSLIDGYVPLVGDRIVVFDSGGGLTANGEDWPQ